MKWIATSPIPSSNSLGYEDRRVGEWFLAANNIKHFKQEWKGVINGVEDIKKPVKNLHKFSNIYWIHSLKSEYALSKAQMHFLENDMADIPDESTQNDSDVAFQLMWNKTHCLDSTYFYSYTIASCSKRKEQMFEWDKDGRIKNLHRNTCLDPFFTWSNESLWQLYHQPPLPDSCTQSHNSFRFEDGYLKFAKAPEKVLIYGKSKDMYANTGLLLEMRNGGSINQKWILG